MRLPDQVRAARPRPLTDPDRIRATPGPSLEARHVLVGTGAQLRQAPLVFHGSRFHRLAAV